MPMIPFEVYWTRKYNKDKPTLLSLSEIHIDPQQIAKESLFSPPVVCRLPPDNLYKYKLISSISHMQFVNDRYPFYIV